MQVDDIKTFESTLVVLTANECCIIDTVAKTKNPIGKAQHIAVNAKGVFASSQDDQLTMGCIKDEISARITFTTDKGPISAIDISNDMVAIASADGIQIYKLRYVDLTTDLPQCRRVIPMLDYKMQYRVFYGPITTVIKFTTDQQHLIVGDNEGWIRIFKIVNDSCVFLDFFDAQSSPITHIDIRQDDDKFVSKSNNAMHHYGLNPLRYSGGTSMLAPGPVCFSSDGKFIVYVTSFGIEVIDAFNFDIINTVSHNIPITAMAHFGNGIYYGDTEGNINYFLCQLPIKETGG